MRIKRYLGKLVCFLRTFFLLGLSFLIIPAFGFFSLAYGHDASLSTTKIKSLISEPLPEYSTILASDGSVIATFYSENRIPTISSDISPLVKKALIATEDARFYSHHGVDWIGTARALISQLEGHGGGGSTITQQYVKNLLVAHASTAVEAASATATNLTRKIKEARGALAIEKVLTKDQILTGYLNTVYFGDGSYGIGAAAEHYFSIAPKDLTLPQAALLVGIVQNPTGLNPRNHPEAAKLRRHHVLSRMLITHAITQEEFNTATSTPITLTISEAANGCAYSPYPQYCQWIRQSLENDPVFGATASARESFLYSGGLTIKTAMEPKAQNAITLAAKKALDPKGTIAVGIAVVRPGTGEVVALGSNKDWGSGIGQTELLYPTLNAFQQGSTFKPFTAATALEAGIPSTFAQSAPNVYTPKDMNSPVGGFHNAQDGEGGYYNMYQALAHSVNTWFVELEDKVGVRPTAETAYKMGLTSLPLTGSHAISSKDASLTLGTYETSPLLVANAYATLAAGGVACTPIGILSIAKKDGTPIAVSPANCHQSIQQSTADTVVDMMKGVIQYGTGTAASLGARPAAGKTGTTESFSAAWFSGFTPQYSTAVWIGDPRSGQQYPLHNVSAYGKVFEPVFGGTIPALIWKDSMFAIHKGLPIVKFNPPGNTIYLDTKFIIPDVRGLTILQATRVLTDAGFTVTLDKTKGPKIPGIVKDRVSLTNPSAGSLISITDNKNISIEVSP